MHRMYDLSGAGEGAGGGGGGASPAKNIDQLDGGGGIGGEEIRGKGGGIRGGGGEIRGKRGGIGAGSSDPSQPKVAARLSQLLFRSMQGCVSDVSPMQAPSPGWQSVASGHTAPPPTWAAVSVQARSFAASHSAVHSDQDPSQSASLWATNIDLRCETRHDGIFGLTVLAGTGAVWPQARSQPTCTAGRFLRTPSRQLRSQRCRTRLGRLR